LSNSAGNAFTVFPSPTLTLTLFPAYTSTITAMPFVQSARADGVVIQGSSIVSSGAGAGTVTSVVGTGSGTGTATQTGSAAATSTKASEGFRIAGSIPSLVMAVALVGFVL
jgi:hypothetical protein